MGARVRPGAPGLKASPPCCPDVDLDLQRSVRAVLRELSAQAPALPSNQGKSRQAPSALSASPTPAQPTPPTCSHEESAPAWSSHNEGLPAKPPSSWKSLEPEGPRRSSLHPGSPSRDCGTAHRGSAALFLNRLLQLALQIKVPWHSRPA